MAGDKGRFVSTLPYGVSRQDGTSTSRLVGRYRAGPATSRASERLAPCRDVAPGATAPARALLGFGVSLLTSGRFTLRLIVDGALSFAFVPLCEFAGFVAVYRVTVTSPPLSQAVNRFFAGNTPWLWWLLSIMVAASLLPAERHGSLMAPILLSAPIPIALSLALDLRFFRDVMGRTTGRAVFDLARGVLDWLRTGDLDGTEICHPGDL